VHFVATRGQRLPDLSGFGPLESYPSQDLNPGPSDLQPDVMTIRPRPPHYSFECFNKIWSSSIEAKLARSLPHPCAMPPLYLRGRTDIRVLHICRRHTRILALRFKLRKVLFFDHATFIHIWSLSASDQCAPASHVNTPLTWSKRHVQACHSNSVSH